MFKDVKFIATPHKIFDLKLSSSEVYVLLALLEHAGPENHTVWPSYARLQKLTGFGRATISAALKGLYAKNVFAYHKGRQNKSNIYTLNHPDKWSAVPLLNSSENSQRFNNRTQRFNNETDSGSIIDAQRFNNETLTIPMNYIQRTKLKELEDENLEIFTEEGKKGKAEFSSIFEKLKLLKDVPK